MKPSPSKTACAICGKPVDPAYRPFCSRRCADVDLQRWLSDRYVVPGEARGEAEEGAPGQDDEG